MTIHVRPCADLDELAQAMVIWQYFGAEPSKEDCERFASLCPVDRMHGAWDGAVCVGGVGAYPFTIPLPGGRSAPSAGVTAVGVATTHRRRGVLTALMRAQLDDVRARGESIAWLWASEAPIYGRFGYGIASFALDIDVPRERTAYTRTWPPYGQGRLLAHAEALEVLPRLYAAAAAQNVGMPSRTRAWWEARRLSDSPVRRQGAGALNRLVLEVDGTPVGYALYRVRNAMEHGITSSALVVVEAVGVNRDATAAIWRHLLDWDWCATIEAVNLPVDHPLLLLLAEPRYLRTRIADALWVRLVEVGAALSARGYPSGEPVVFEVDDSFCAWNTGRWRLADGVAARTEAPADLRLGVDALGSAYLGGFTFRRLWEAGRVEELRPGALALADRVFAAERAPWCPEVF